MPETILVTPIMPDQGVEPLPHFFNGEGILVVRNTFIELSDDVPAPPSLDRAQTAPWSMVFSSNCSTVGIDRDELASRVTTPSPRGSEYALSTAGIDRHELASRATTPSPRSSEYALSTAGIDRHELASRATTPSPRSSEYALSSPDHDDNPIANGWPQHIPFPEETPQTDAVFYPRFPDHDGNPNATGWPQYFPCPVEAQQTDAVFYPSFWLEGQPYSGLPAYPSNAILGHQDVYHSHMSGHAAFQFDPLHANSLVAPPQLPNSEINKMPETPQPQTVSIHEGPIGSFEVIWNVDARKLRSGDQQAVSPPFNLSLGEELPQTTFKMMIYPIAKSDGRGGASFKKAGGRGNVIIKCESDVSSVPTRIGFSLAAGSRGARGTETKHGVHDFAQSAICGLPANEAEWVLTSFVDPASDTFAIFLNVTPLLS